MFQCVQNVMYRASCHARGQTHRIVKTVAQDGSWLTAVVALVSKCILYCSSQGHFSRICLPCMVKPLHPYWWNLVLRMRLNVSFPFPSLPFHYFVIFLSSHSFPCPIPFRVPFLSTLPSLSSPLPFLYSILWLVSCSGNGFSRIDYLEPWVYHPCTYPGHSAWPL